MEKRTDELERVADERVSDFITGVYLALLSRLKNDTTYWEAAYEYVSKHEYTKIRDLPIDEALYILEVKGELIRWKFQK